jgi:hypothetical protein
MARQINSAGLDLIASSEGLRLNAYQDVAGIWTSAKRTLQSTRQHQRSQPTTISSPRWCHCVSTSDQAIFGLLPC